MKNPVKYLYDLYNSGMINLSDYATALADYNRIIELEKLLKQTQQDIVDAEHDFSEKWRY
jgi:hypothetical protein